MRNIKKITNALKGIFNMEKRKKRKKKIFERKILNKRKKIYHNQKNVL